METTLIGTSASRFSLSEMKETGKQSAQPGETANDERQTETDTLQDVAPAIELLCWTVVALAPILRWVNGPAVTTDQFVFQVALFAMASVAAIGLRVYNWRRNSAR
jgi:hypothetical protein